MHVEFRKAEPKVCPNCHKPIPKTARPPRDLGLILHHLTYSLPLEVPITEEVIEAARLHCHMKLPRLRELRAPAYAIRWRRMLNRRKAILAYIKEHGEPPGRWEGLLPGEPDRVHQLYGAWRYRKGGCAKLKARVRRHPDTASAKLATRYKATRRIRSTSRKSAALDDVLLKLAAHSKAGAGKLTLKEYEALLAGGMIPDPPRRRRKKSGGMESDSEKPKENAGGEARCGVPRSGPAGDAPPVKPPTSWDGPPPNWDCPIDWSRGEETPSGEETS